MLDIDIAWAAGIIDGEGCISIIRIPAKSQSGCLVDRFTLNLKVTMGHEPTIRRLHELFRIGSVQLHKPCGPRVNASYSWICQSRQARTTLSIVASFLVTKKKEVRVALEFMELPLARRGGPGGSCVTNVRLFKKREKLYWKLRRLKPRWKFYSERMALKGAM